MFSRSTSICRLFFGLSLCLIAGQALATTFYVKTPAAGGSDENDGLSWASAFETPAAALAVAANGDEIWVATGTYEGAVQIRNRQVQFIGGFAGTEASLSDRVLGENETVLTLGAGQVGAVLRIVGTPSSQTVIDGFTIRGGTTAGSSFYAGGMVFDQGSPIIRNNNFVNNVSQNYGGAITFYEGSPVIEYNRFVENQSVGGTEISEAGSSGGAVWGYGGNATYRYNTFIGNSAADSGTFGTGDGGAIWQYEGTLTLIGNTFEDNQAATNGGAVWQYEGTLIAASNVFVRNSATADAGGGVWGYSTNMWVANNTFVSNTSLFTGAGLYCFEGPMQISNNIFFSHEAGEALSTDASTGTANSNLFYGNFWDASSLLTQSGTVLDDPQFTDAINGDYTLSATSPAVDAGDANELPPEATTDRNGEARVAGGAPDIGAYERAAGDAYCPADFNQDGGVDGTDVQAFFTAWEVSDLSADTNQDGGVDGSDVEAFFTPWEQGGC